MRAWLVWTNLLVAACSGSGNGGSAPGGAGVSMGGNSSGGTQANGNAGATPHENGGASANAGAQTTGGAGAASSGGSSARAGTSAGGSNAGSNASAAGETNDGGAGAGCAGFSDTFAGSSLDACWLILNGTPQAPLIEVAVSDGALHLSAHGSVNGVWYQGSTKALVYKLVSEPAFKVTATMQPRKATDATALPTKDLHVGGFLLRDPASKGGSSENYLLFMTGHSENNNGMVHQGVELKSTANGCSNWAEPDWGATATEPDAELRVCRLGANFRFYKRVPGAASWTPATPPAATCAGNVVQGDLLTRADLPATLQVGLALNFNAPSDLQLSVDDIELVALPANATEADCISD